MVQITTIRIGMLPYCVSNVKAEHANDELSLKNKLKGRAKSTGLLRANNKDGGEYDGGAVVFMHVLKLAD